MDAARDPAAPIRTERLELVPYTAPMMRAVVDGDDPAAARLLGASLTIGLDDELREFFALRLPDLVADPARLPWLARAIILVGAADDRRVVGSVGFHGSPDDAGRVEIGYQVEAGSRRRGIAIEAVRAMLDWAAAEHGIHRFRASIAPDNVASLALAGRLGFVIVGRRTDDVEGEELVLERDDLTADSRDRVR
ncbi:MAG: GNAT family N-acetyltransferase [Candidatus Limnocylindrales bacterium]